MDQTLTVASIQGQPFRWKDKVYRIMRCDYVGGQAIVEVVPHDEEFVPLVWYPRLKHATAKERNNWKLIGDGEGIHWNDLDEDVSVRDLLLGQPSGESQKSFERWLKNRSKRKH